MAATLPDLNVKLFTDGADKAQILEMTKQPWIRGFTTNPSLMKGAQVTDYVPYARELVAVVPERHISFEVFSDDIAEMVEQARVINTWGSNVYVKLPMTTTRGEPLFPAIRALSHDAITSDGSLHCGAGGERRRSALRRRSRLRVGVCRSSCRRRHRSSADYARGGRPGTQDD